MNARHPTLGDDAPVTVAVESKFMQNFRVATAVNPGAGLASTRNGSGDTEFFSIGTDQAVHNYYADPASDTGYSPMPIGVFADTIGVTLNAAGAIVVFAAGATTLTMVTEQPGQAQRWSAPVQLQVPMPFNPRLIAGIYTATDGSTCYLALLIQTPSTAPGAAYQLVLATMAGTQPPVFVKTGLAFSSLNCAWMGNTAATMQFVCADGALVSVTPAGQGTRLPMRASFQSLSVASAVDVSGNAQLFAVLADGNAYRLLNSNGSHSWAQLTHNQSFTQIAAEPDGRGNIHLLCVGAGRLSHLMPVSERASGYGDPTPVLAKVSALVMASNDDGDVEAFAGNATALNYLAWAAQSTHWDVLPVEIQQEHVVEDYSSYGSDVQLRDASGAPLAQQGVTITASETTRITVNGATYFVDTHRAAHVTTNETGMLNIQQPTNALSVPTLLLSVPGLMPPGDVIAISQDMVTQVPLAALTGPALYAATTNAGTPVLPDAYRTLDQAAAIASAVAQAMGLATQSVPLAAAAGARVRRPRPGVRVIHQADVYRLRQLAPHQPQHWRFSVANGVAQFQVLSANDAQIHLQSLRATSRQVGGFIDFVTSLGDLIAGAAEGLVDIVETTVTTVGNAIHAAVQFAVDGVTYLFETAVDEVEQLFDVAEAVFAQVKVFFQTLYEWQGFIFNWPDIVRTAKAMNYTVNQFLGFFQGAVGGMQAFFDQGTGKLQATIGSLFSQAIQSVGGASVGGYADCHEPDDPQVQGALSNNPIFNALLDHAGAMKPSAALSRALAASRINVGDDPYAAIEQALQASTTNATGNANFAPMQNYFTTMGSARGNVFSSLLQGMLAVVRDLIQAVLSGLQTIVDQLLRLLQTMMGAFTSALNEDWNVPILSPLFAHATNGMPMSTVNLISLVMAIPATVLYKAVYNKAPFASDADLAAFENAWDANTLLRASGLRGESAMGSQRALMRAAQLGDTSWTGLLPQGVAPVIAILGAVAAYFNAGISAVTDAAPEGDHIEPLSICGFVTEVLGQAASCPWFYAAGVVGCSGDSAGYLNWTYANLGVALDLLYLVAGESIPSDVQSVITHLYGNVHLALSILASTGQSAADIASNILAVIPETGKILKFSGIVAATEGISLVVLAVLDAVCLPVAATIHTVETIAHHPPADSLALFTPLAAAAFAEAPPPLPNISLAGLPRPSATAPNTVPA